MAGEDFATQEEHMALSKKAMNSDPRIGFDKRFECRTWLALQEGLDDLFALERPLDEGEAEEPESHIWT